MNEIMNWAAHYNSLVIQVVFSIVLLLVLVYIYRLFFVTSISSTQTGDSSAELTEVNEKLNQLLKQGHSPTISSSEKVGAAAPGLQGELEKLKAENLQLKTQLNESEKKVFEMTPVTSAEGEAPAVSDKAVAPPVEDKTALVNQLNKKVEELQSRLSEYDIIADDIAELSQLRAENNELKKRLEGSSGFESILAAVPQLDAAMAAPEPVAPEPVAPEAVPEVAALPDLDLPAADIEVAAAEPEEVVADIHVDQVVAPAEKELMSEFEKATQKGS